MSLKYSDLFPCFVTERHCHVNILLKHSDFHWENQSLLFYNWNTLSIYHWNIKTFFFSCFITEIYCQYTMPVLRKTIYNISKCCVLTILPRVLSIQGYQLSYEKFYNLSTRLEVVNLNPSFRKTKHARPTIGLSRLPAFCVSYLSTYWPQTFGPT